MRRVNAILQLAPSSEPDLARDLLEERRGRQVPHVVASLGHGDNDRHVIDAYLGAD
jgi:hypothetical protein